MKFNISRPPTEGKNTIERLERLTSWLSVLSEALNVTLANLGEDNFTPSVREAIFEKKEETNDDI